MDHQWWHRLASAIKTELHDADRRSVYAEAIANVGDENLPALRDLFGDDPVFREACGEPDDDDGEDNLDWVPSEDDVLDEDDDD